MRIILILIVLLLLVTPANAQVGNPSLHVEPGKLRIEWSSPELWTNWYAEVCLLDLDGNSSEKCFLFRNVDISRYMGVTYFWNEYCVPSDSGYLIMSSRLLEKIGDREIGVFFLPGSVYYPLCNHSYLPNIER